MDIQTIIVAIIMFIAAIYVSKRLLSKTKAFSVKKNSCGNNCGCETKN